MALTCTLEPIDAPVDGPLIRTHPSHPTTVTVALPTVPGRSLGAVGRNRLARQVAGAERRLARVVPPSLQRTRTVRQMWDLVDRAEEMPTAEGLALVAGPVDGRLVTLQHPTTVSVLVGDVPSLDELVEAVWCIGRAAVLHITGRECRLVCVDGASLWEPTPPWDPLGRSDELDVVASAQGPLSAALPGAMPVVVAGDDRLVERLDPANRHRWVAAHLSGDHSDTAMATLATLARPGSATDARRRSALGDGRPVAGLARGTAVRGADALRSLPTLDDRSVVLVEADLRPEVDGIRGATGVVASPRVVTFPDGFLASHGRVAVVPDRGSTPVAGSPAQATRRPHLRLAVGAR